MSLETRPKLNCKSATRRRAAVPYPTSSMSYIYIHILRDYILYELYPVRKKNKGYNSYPSFVQVAFGRVAWLSVASEAGTAELGEAK